AAPGGPSRIRGAALLRAPALDPVTGHRHAGPGAARRRPRSRSVGLAPDPRSTARRRLVRGRDATEKSFLTRCDTPVGPHPACLLGDFPPFFFPYGAVPAARARCDDPVGPVESDRQGSTGRT